MKDEDYELEMLLEEIPHATSSCHSHHHQHVYDDDDPLTYQGSPAGGGGSSSSSSFSGWFSSSDDGGSPTTPLNTNYHFPLANTQNSNGLESKLSNVLALGNNAGHHNLVSQMNRMYIGDELEVKQHFQSPNSSPVRFRTNYGNVENNGIFQDCRNRLASLKSFDGGRRSTLSGLQQQCQMGNLLGSCILPDSYSPLLSYQAQCTVPIGFPQKHVSNDVSLLSRFQCNVGDDGFRGNPHGRGVQGPYTTRSSPILENCFVAQQNQTDFTGQGGVFIPRASPQMTLPNVSLGMDRVMYNSAPTISARGGGTKHDWVPQSLPSRRGAWDLDGCKCDDSLVMQGKGLNYMINMRLDRPNERIKASFNEIPTACSHVKSLKLDDQCCRRVIPFVNYEIGRDPKISSSMLLPWKDRSLLDIQSNIYSMAKDQYGCRFLQQKFDEGAPHDVQMMFQEIIPHVPELMINPFGNYLVQKLLVVCNDEQRMHMLLMLTSEPGKLVKISLNMHGTRAVQKLIGTLKTRPQILLIVSSLEPGFIDLIMDLNGNHVIQRCLQCLSNEDNKFIFDAAAKFCDDIAVHRHGCCVLQRCIDYATGEHREKLVAKISSKAYELAKDPYGNYVIQYILKLKMPSATAILLSQFEGKYVELSQNKYSSNVVEKCLEAFGEEGRSSIIKELFSNTQIEHLLQHPFANYVIHAVIGISKGSVRDLLIEAIRPYATDLRTNPYCKRIFSRAFSKK